MDIQQLFRDVSPSVVLVEQDGRIDYFSVGSVILSEEKDRRTFILTHSSMLDSHSPARLSVRFSDRHKQTAEFVLRHGPYCILSTCFYPKCKPLQFFDGEIENVRAFTVAPASSRTVYNLEGFVMQKSIPAGGDESGSILKDYEDFFVFTCRYGDCLPSGWSRLLIGPVFNMDGKTLGLVITDLGYKQVLDLKEEIFIELGFTLKICINAGHLQRLLEIMTRNSDWRKGLIMVEKDGTSSDN